MNKKTVFLALIFFSTGFILAYLYLGQENVKIHQSSEVNPGDYVSSVEEDVSLSNPFLAKDNDRLSNLEDELELIKQQMNELEFALQNISTSVDAGSKLSRTVPVNKNRLPSVFNRRIYNIDNLVKAGIDAGVAEDIVRRKNSIELKKLELHDRAKRDGYLGTQRYNDELESIDLQDVDLREELGDDRYDEYLFKSKQNNRIKIVSVMLGSAAELAGIQQNDVVLSYDNVRMFSWQELKNATSEGQLGEYVAIDIYRDGAIYSFSVPRGPLGMQLGATRLEP
jgi:hypothetical protein